ncbi:hypothetical protein MUP95_00355, partial [bacterium]|nr:hypothetical protein [bacterium]
GTWLQGGLSFRLRGETIDPSKQWISLSGELIMDSLNVKKEHIAYVKQIQGMIPFQFNVDLNQQILLPELNFRPLTWVEYENQRMVYQNLLPGVGNLRVQQIDIAGYRLNNLAVDFDIGKGYIQVPWFGVEVMDGNCGGSIAIQLGNGSRNDVSYEIHAHISRVHSAALMDIQSSGEKETELNATLAFQGKGIDLEQEVDLDGFFYITEIGADFASTLLKAMDPQDTDRSIRLTRRLLNMGWKPKLFSFELRHGYVYPALSLTQPWYSPIRIPEYLEYGRLPLAFFLRTKSNVD